MEENYNELISWMSSLINESFESNNITDILKDGTVLCRLANAISSGSCTYSKSKSKFKQMENINNFILAARKLGVPDEELFQTVDLSEEKNIKQVVICLYSLSRNVQKSGVFKGPFIGPKLADKRNIEFSEDVIRKGESVVHLQMGHYVDMADVTKNYGIRRQITLSSNDKERGEDGENKGN